MKPTIKVHVRADGSEYVIRLIAGRQHWDHNQSCQHMGEVLHLVQKSGGTVQTRPAPRIQLWDDSMLPLVQHYLTPNCA
jgi:hypothetical protein